MPTWKQTASRFRPGRIVGPESNPTAYLVRSTDERGISCERVATGSPVRATRKMIESAAARLDAGEVIPRRTISYTVAIETLVVLALGARVEECTTEDGTRAYRAVAS